MKTKHYYYVYYVEGCTPSMKRFSTKKDRTKFIDDFTQSSQGNDDNWVDFTFTGRLDELHTQYTLGSGKKGKNK